MVSPFNLLQMRFEMTFEKTILGERDRQITRVRYNHAVCRIGKCACASANDATIPLARVEFFFFFDKSYRFYV